MAQRLNLTLQTGLVLLAIARGYRYGFDIMDVSGLPDGTVYPALRRFEAAGLVVADWEDSEVAARAKRPARRYYRLTAAGEATLERALARYRGLDRVVTHAEPLAEGS